MAPLDCAVAIVRHICHVAGPTSLVENLHDAHRRDGVLTAVQRHDTPALFSWLMSELSYQGIADSVAEGYIARHGTKRVAKAVLIGAVPPLMLKTGANPGGLPIDVFDGIRNGVLADRSQFFKDLTLPFYGYNRSGAKVSEGVREQFWLQGMMAGMPASYFCVKAFSETDQTEDLRKMNVPTLILHGDDDQIVPIADSALLSAKLVKGAILKVYKGAPHGMCTTHKDQVNEDLLAFLKGEGPRV